MYRPVRIIVTLGMICTSLTGYGQFSTTVGFPPSVQEKAVSGLIAPGGGYVVLGDNNGHPNDLFTGNGDLEMVWLDNAGNLLPTSRMLGKSTADNAVWIEKDVICGGNNHYIIVGNDPDDILVTMTDLSGTPVWARSIGSTTNIETGAWAEMDANGLIHVVGSEFDVNTGVYSVILAQLDCNGNDNYRLKYTLSGYALTATSATTFATAPGGPGIIYITGRATPTAGGDEQLFILRINSSSGSPVFIKTYDIAANWSDLGTCIQGSVTTVPQGAVWVSGFSTAPNGPRNVLMMQTDLNGLPVWAKNYDLVGGWEYATHFELAANNKLVVTGVAEVNAPTQGPATANCLLMRVDATTGTPDWSRVFTNSPYASIGNRVEVTASDEYFITGESIDLAIPQIAGDILAIRTDAQGLLNSPNCYHDVQFHDFIKVPVTSSPSLGSIAIGQVDNLTAIMLGTANYTDQQVSCSTPPPPDCDFTWASSGCFQMQLTGTTSFTVGGNYTFKWDIGCDNTFDVVSTVASNTATITYNFPCGGGTFPVCLTVTDPLGMVCSVTHMVIVGSCNCWSVSNTSLMCSVQTGNPTTYDFSMNVTNLYPSATNCTYTLTPQAGLNYFINPVFSTNGSVTTISGSVTWPGNVPLPSVFGFTIGATCSCPGGPSYSCNIPVNLATVCCKKIAVFDQVVCESAVTYDVPFQTLNTAILHNITRVTWYVQAKPANGICPTVPWGGIPYQDGPASSLTPLHLYPQALTTDLCVYVVVHLNEGPCQMITSNIACISRCAPGSCSMTGYEYCYTGTPVVPGLLTSTNTSPSNACFPYIEWLDPSGNVVQVGGSTYQPTAGLSMSNPANCYEDFFYTVQITDDCGIHSCQAPIRLYSDSAPKGQLSIDPFEQPPFCRNEDATLVFTPGCAGDPKMWKWYQRPCTGGAALYLSEAGTSNPILNLNQLTTSNWYYVESQNGVCPLDTVQLKIEVKKPIAVTNFSAIADNCVEIQTALNVSFTPCMIAGCNTPCTCGRTIEWYKDGFLIGSTQTNTNSASFIYTTLPLYGNYYAIVKDDCCPNQSAMSGVQTVLPACVPKVEGPCFMCDNTPVILMGSTEVPINNPCPYPCTYQWYIWNTQTLTWDILPGETGTTYTALTPGSYLFESICNGCTKSAQFDLLGCTSGPMFAGSTDCVIIQTIEASPADRHPLLIYPNPTTGEITVEWKTEAPKDCSIFITDAMGRRLRTFTVPYAAASLNVRMDDLPSGMYFIKVQAADRFFTTAKVVKE